MRYAAMIQARCDSSRLPGKVLMDLGGKPVLRRVIERVQRSRNVDEVFVVTSIGTWAFGCSRGRRQMF